MRREIHNNMIPLLERALEKIQKAKSNPKIKDILQKVCIILMVTTDAETFNDAKEVLKDDFSIDLDKKKYDKDRLIESMEKMIQKYQKDIEVIKLFNRIPDDAKKCQNVDKNMRYKISEHLSSLLERAQMKIQDAKSDQEIKTILKQVCTIVMVVDDNINTFDQAKQFLEAQFSIDLNKENYDLDELTGKMEKMIKLYPKQLKKERRKLLKLLGQEVANREKSLQKWTKSIFDRITVNAKDWKGVDPADTQAIKQSLIELLQHALRKIQDAGSNQEIKDILKKVCIMIMVVGEMTFDKAKLLLNRKFSIDLNVEKYNNKNNLIAEMQKMIETFQDLNKQEDKKKDNEKDNYILSLIININSVDADYVNYVTPDIRKGIKRHKTQLLRKIAQLIRKTKSNGEEGQKYISDLVDKVVVIIMVIKDYDRKRATDFLKKKYKIDMEVLCKSFDVRKEKQEIANAIEHLANKEEREEYQENEQENSSDEEGSEDEEEKELSDNSSNDDEKNIDNSQIVIINGEMRGK